MCSLFDCLDIIRVNVAIMCGKIIFADCRKSIVVVQSNERASDYGAFAKVRFVESCEIVDTFVLLLGWI